MLNVTVDEILRDPSKYLRQVEAGETFVIVQTENDLILCGVMTIFLCGTRDRIASAHNGSVRTDNGNVSGRNGNVSGRNGNVSGRNGNVSGRNGNVSGRNRIAGGAIAG
jgi:hypothetical protein